jgi:DNA-directed RNA polymerase specialized sigma24 family protein
MTVSPPPFQRFLDAHGEDVWRFLVASVGRDAADDCFQETFLSAMRAYPRMHPDNPRAWVMTIAHRKALDHFRARKRRAVPVGDNLPDVVAPPPLPPPPPPEPRDDGVWARVHALPPKQRAAVLLRFAGDLSHREVAAAMGVSEDAARRNAFEGLRRLRQEMTT